MKPRKKAQDVFNDTKFVFAEKTTFEKAFPQVKAINVEVSETGDGIYHGQRIHRYNKGTIGEYVNCSNSYCYNGGFRIGDIIREMVYSRVEDREGSDECQGNEGSPKGRKVYRKCLNHFSYKIHIDFLEDSKELEQ